MRSMIYVTAALALCAGSTAALSKHTAAAGTNIHKSSWTYTYKGTKRLESVDADGNYITQSTGGKHLDHGTVVMKDKKFCFTSAMNNEGESCWTAAAMKVGQSRVSTSDKGEKLRVTLVKYRPLSMPKSE